MKNAFLPVLAFVLLSACGGGSNSSSSPNPTGVAGQWSVVGTSTQGSGTTNVYADLVQETNTFFGADSANIAVCPNNNVSQCEIEFPIGNTLLRLSGTVDGNQVQMMVTNATGNVTTFNGTISGQTMSGTYTAPGDAGTWTAQMSGPLTGTYSGTVTSQLGGIPISVRAVVTQGSGLYNLTGTASLSNSPCFTSLNFDGNSQAMGGAMLLVDSSQGVQIMAVPTGGGSFAVIYQVNEGACKGDSGSGTFTKQ